MAKANKHADHESATIPQARPYREALPGYQPASQHAHLCTAVLALAPRNKYPPAWGLAILDTGHRAKCHVDAGFVESSPA